MNLQGIVGSGLRTSPHHTAQARRNPCAVHLRRYFYPDHWSGFRVIYNRFYQNRAGAFVSACSKAPTAKFPLAVYFCPEKREI